MVSIIIPTIKGREDLLNKLLTSIPNEYEVIVIPDENLSLAQKRNKGAAVSTGDYLLFIDDDNYLKDDAIDRLLEYFSKTIGIIGMVAHYNNDPDRISDGGSDRGYISGFMRGIDTNKLGWDGKTWCYQVDEVANAFMIRRELFMRLHGFDWIRFPIDLDEADLCIRVKKLGYEIRMCPRAICYHRSITYSWMPDFRKHKNAYMMGRNRILFQRKHLSRLFFGCYLVAFLPLFVISYTLCLLYRKKPLMLYYFLKGVKHGLQNRF